MGLQFSDRIVCRNRPPRSREPLVATLKPVWLLIAGVTLLNAPQAAAQVRIDVSTTYQVMEGFGSSSRVWDDPHVSNARRTVIPPEAQHEILTKLYAELGLTRVRPVLDGGIEHTNDNGNPFSFDWARFNFEWKRNDAHVELVKQAIPYGLRVYFSTPILLEKWMTESNPEEYVEWAMAVLLRWRDLGLEMPYYSITNEPGYKRGGIWSAEWMKTVVKLLGARMEAEGLNTMLVIPDDINPGEAYKRSLAVLEDPEARQYVAALAYHLYGKRDRDLRRMRDLSLRYGIPLWMSEYSEPRYVSYSGAMRWIRTVHDLIANYRISAVDYMWGFFGSWEDHGAHSLVQIKFDHGVYRGYKLSPTYYLTGQFSRFVRPGHVRVEASSADRDILVTAYKGSRDLVVVVINAGHDRKQVSFTLTGGPMPRSLLPVRTSRTEKWKRLAPVMPQYSSFTISLPAASVTTFVGTMQTESPTSTSSIDGRK